MENPVRLSQPPLRLFPPHNAQEGKGPQACRRAGHQGQGGLPSARPVPPLPASAPYLIPIGSITLEPVNLFPSSCV